MSTNLLEHPRDVDSGRYICTKDMPMPIDTGRSLWMHPDAKTTDEHDPYYDHYLCPNCKTHFAVEVPE